MPFSPARIQSIRNTCSCRCGTSRTLYSYVVCLLLSLVRHRPSKVSKDFQITSFHKLSVPVAPGSQTLLSTSDSQVLPLWVTLSPCIYGFVESGCSHSGITSGSGISTFVQRDGETSGCQSVCAACSWIHLYSSPPCRTLFRLPRFDQ